MFLFPSGMRSILFICLMTLFCSPKKNEKLTEASVLNEIEYEDSTRIYLNDSI